MPVSYGQSNISAPSFLDMFGKGFGESLGQSISQVIDKFQKKKAMDELQQTLLNNPDTAGEVSTPLFQLSKAMKDPSFYIQGKIAGRDQKKELPFESYAGQIPGFEKLLKQGAIGPPTEAGVKPAAPTALAQTKMTPEEARSAIGTYGAELAREQGKYTLSYGINPQTGQSGPLRFNTLTGAMEPIPGLEGTLPVPKTPEKHPSVGADREAVANEMFGKSFYELDQSQQNRVESQVNKSKTELAGARGRAYKSYQFYDVIDTSDNTPKKVSGKILLEAETKEPGRYAPTAVTERALTRTALLEDIRGFSGDLRGTITKLKPEEFDNEFKLKVAYILGNEVDPRGTSGAFLTGKAAESLTDNQRNYLIQVTNLAEKALGLRLALGAGQGAQDVREAIRATIPGRLTPDTSFALKQLDQLDKTLDRVERGIPAVKLRDIIKERNKESTGKGKKMNLDDYLNLHEGK